MNEETEREKLRNRLRDEYLRQYEEWGDVSPDILEKPKRIDSDEQFEKAFEDTIRTEKTDTL